MEELVEILSESGKSTGRNTSKFEAHKHGICHGISAIGLINKDGRLLIQKRDKNKKDEPNKWDLSSAGHIDVNETPEDAAIREMYEELSIKIEKNDLILIDTYLYIVKKDIDNSKITMQKKEVSDIRFVSKKEYFELLNEGKMVEGIKHCGKLLNYIK